MQLSENIKMTNFHLTFLWIFPYNMGNNDRKGADPGMRKVDHNKQQKRESLLDSAFSLFIDNGFNKTSIADIVKNAGVAKHTCISYILICKDLLTVDSCKKLLAKLLVARLAEKSEHVLLVALNTWLIEWIYTKCVSTHTTCKLKCVE